MKRVFAAVIALFFLSVCGIPAFGAGIPPDTSEYSRVFLARRAALEDKAYMHAVLEGLGLFRGTENGAELDRGLTRAEALVTIVRLRGAEAEALELNLASGFSDVPAWAEAYAGFARAQGFARGLRADRLGADDPITAKQYATMLLRLLGYDDTAGDFSYDTALDFAYEAELTDEWAAARYKEREANGGAFLRGDAVYFMYRALYAPAPSKASGESVIAKLYKEGRIDGEAATKTLRAHGESEKEILRALENGYSEVLLAAATEAVNKNNSALSDLAQSSLKTSLYNWSKEAGSAEGAALFAHNAQNLRISFVPSRQDPLFRADPNVAAYFSYPNHIVVRSDTDKGSVKSALTHELRHALSADIGLTALEEGLTEFWNQEVDGGDYGYPYYFVNLAKLLVHIAGAAAVNAGDLTGDYEDLFYALERESGVDIDNIELYALLADISPSAEMTFMRADEDLYEKLAAVNAVFLALARGFYLNNTEERVSESANREAFVDRLLALGQLLFYPSAMIHEADSDSPEEAPSAYYGEDFLEFANAAVLRYCEVSGADAASALRYFEENKDRRFCLEYLGKDAGVMFVKGGPGYRVTFRSGKDLYYNDFGTREEADSFAANVDAVGVETVAGAGFTPKRY
ncbi:MAG: hypothetical protein LBE16_06055 [Clostridiales Family XIII bacterium]|jgi:hypothetical protein|nr:hypothetical protein [Clostridiales Family XIII bacterium]